MKDMTVAACSTENQGVRLSCPILTSGEEEKGSKGKSKGKHEDRDDEKKGKGKGSSAAFTDLRFTVGALLCIGRWGDLWGTNGSRNGSQPWDTPKRTTGLSAFSRFFVSITPNGSSAFSRCLITINWRGDIYLRLAITMTLRCHF